jgi:LPS-assembly lipoprotein
MLGFGAAGLLAGCGFQLRGTGVKMPFSSLQIRGVGSPGLISQLSAQLKSSGVEVIRNAHGGVATTPEIMLDILQDQRERVVVGTTAAGQVRELQLRHRLRFRLRTPQGRDLIPETELLQERELSFTETQVLGKEEEEALLYNDMQSGMVRQLMSRFAAAQPQ